MLKISTKISLLYLATTAAIIILMAISMYNVYYSQRLQSIDTELQDYANFLSSNIELENSNISFVFQAMSDKKGLNKEEFNNNFMFVLTDNDSIIYESNDLIKLDSLIKLFIDDELFYKKHKFDYIEYEENTYRIFKKYVDLKKDNDLQIVMIASLKRFDESLLLLKYILFIICPGFLLIAAIIASIIAKKSFAPVLQITKAAELISAQNLDKRVPVGNANDEITYLAHTFNEMIDRLDKNFKSQKQFITDASHDFRTPLTVMRLEFELLLSESNLDDKFREFLEKNLMELKSLSNLADNLLILARADSNQLILDKEYFRIDELIFSVVSYYKNLAAQKGVTFLIELNEDYEIYADKEMMKRVVNNLIDNAVKYSINDSQIEIILTNINNKICLEISNFCLKFDNSEINIFDRFYRQQNSRTVDGFGLGLPIVKTILDTHNFEIDYDFKINIFKILIKI